MATVLKSAILATVVVGFLLLASCSTTQSTPGATTAEAKPYGSLKIGLNFQGGTFVAPAGTALQTSNPFQTLGAPMFDSLLDLSPEGQLRPALAERWEISRDGLKHSFYLRKGIKFQDGSDLTAADVKFTVDNFVAPPSGAWDAPTWRGALANVEVVDDYTVVFHMKQPQFELLRGFLELSGGPAVLPKKYIEEKGWDYFSRNPIGSGPWKAVSFVPNSRLELEAVENHWRAAPKFKNITLVYVPEIPTRMAMLKTGELDISSEILPDSIAGLKAAGLKTVGVSGGSQFFGAMFWDLDNPDKYALGNLKVRKALSLAINRTEMADKLYGGYARPTALFYVAPTAYFFDPNLLKPDPFDPEGAKKLLAEAGYPSGFSTKLWETGGGGIMSTANESMAGYWRKMGVSVDLAPGEYMTVVARYSPKHTPEIWNTMFTQTTSGVFHFERMVIGYHSTKGAFKNTRNPRLDELIDKVPQTADPAEKKRMAQEAATLAKNEYSMLSIVDVNAIYAYGSKVGELNVIKGLTNLGPSLDLITHAK